MDTNYDNWQSIIQEGPKELICEERNKKWAQKALENILSGG